jgi:hypothetical protein
VDEHVPDAVPSASISKLSAAKERRANVQQVLNGQLNIQRLLLSVDTFGSFPYLLLIESSFEN